MDDKVPADAMRAFSRIVHLLTDTLNTLSRPMLVEVGSVLYTIERLAHKALDDIKTKLREDDEVADAKGGTLHWGGTSRGKVSITVPADSFKVAKGADLSDLQARLGPAYHDYFDTHTRTVLRKGIQDELKLASSEDRQAVLAVLEQVEGTPRVSFQRK
jgi:hypothetical protein